ncbi:hypothetical protein EPO15_03690 [bacterium]|nr:MAG: hypothetical protein EPO15_03690 [bacterium]
MSAPEGKDLVPAPPPPPPAETGWQFSFSLTRAEGAKAALPWHRRLTPLDLALAAAALAVFLVEPFAIHMLLTHYKVPLAAPACAPSQQVVVVQAPAEAAAPETPKGPEAGSDVITPLNERDPSSLIMGPGR